MKQFIIQQNDAKQRLDKFVTKAVPNLPQALLYKYIRTKHIKVNGKRTDIAYRLAVGDTVQLYLKDSFFVPQADRLDFLHAPKQLCVLYEDENILALDKPVGLLSHADDRQYTDTLLARMQRYLYDNGEYDPQQEASFVPALVNRIDRNTGGIVLAAKNAEALRILNEKMKQREIRKTYLCVVHGVPAVKTQTLHGYLYKDRKNNQVHVYRTPGSGRREIITHYRVLESRGGLSLLEVELRTGRTHQIRAHLAFIGHPLLGDGKYGRNRQNKLLGYKRQFLYSYRTEFTFSTPAGSLSYLQGRRITVPDIWFVRAFHAGELDLFATQ